MKAKYFHLLKITVLILLPVLLSYEASFSQQTTWSRIYGESGVSEQGIDVQQTFDGNYAVLASKSYDGNNQKILLIKLNESGNVIWEKLVAGNFDHHTPCRFQQTSDSGFIISGVSDGAFLIKTNKDGELIWRKVYNDTYPTTYASSVIEIPDGFIFCGRASFTNPASDKSYLVRTNMNGDVIREKVYTDSVFSGFCSIALSNDGNYIYATGVTYNATQPLTYYTLIKKLSLDGDIVWSKVLAKNSSGQSIVMLDENSFIVSCKEQSTAKPRLLKLDTQGNILSDNVYYLPRYSGLSPFICKDIRGNVYFAGDYYNKTGVSGISNSGSQVFINSYNPSGTLYSNSHGIRNTSDLGFIIIGTSVTGDGDNVLVLKTDSLCHAPNLVNVTINNHSLDLDYKLYQNYPNPFNNQTVIRFYVPENLHVDISIYDLLGRKVVNLLNGNLQRGEYALNFDSQGLSSGTYLYTLQTKSNTITKALTIIK